MLPSTPSPTLPAEFLSAAADSATCPPAKRAGNWTKNSNGLTLVEVMVSLLLTATVMLGFISAFLQSRRTTEANVLQAAASSLVYGIIEQIKGLDYATLLPNGQIDPAQVPAVPLGTPLPYYTVRVRINPDLTVWLRPVYTPATTDNPPGAAPRLPVAPNLTASQVGAFPGAIDNVLGNLPLSTVTGTRSQTLALNIWLWIDEIPDRANDVSEVKKITLVYTYSYNDGNRVHTVRDGEVFLRTRFDQ